MSEEISKSKQKRLAIKEERAKAKKRKIIRTFSAIFIPLAIVCIVVGVVFYLKSVSEANKVVYDRFLNEDGTIKDINIDDYITFNYKDMTFNRDELLPTEETIESNLANLQDSHKYISDDASLLSKEGDQVNICYSSSIDGVSYNEVTNESGGADFTIGDAVISEEFDKALIGHKKGDELTTSVSYDSDYAVEELAGKTVDYSISFNGIYIIPEFDDEFVKEYLSDQASTRDEYVQLITDDYFKSNLSDAVSSSISENYVIKQLPEEYIADNEKALKAQAIQQFDYYNQMYAAYGMEPMKNVYEMYGLSSDEEFTNMIHENAVKEAENFLAMQYVYAHEGLTNTPDEVKNYFTEVMGYSEDDYNSYITEYGLGYLASAALQGRVMEFLVDNANIN